MTRLSPLRRALRAAPHHILPAAAALSLASCSLDAYLQQRQDKLVEEYRALPDYGQLPVRVISWRQAVQLALAGNPDYRQAQENLAHAEHECGQTWRNFIPSIDIGYYYSRALFRSGGDYYRSGGDFNTNVMFMLPELTRLPVEHYGRLLAVRKAQIDLTVKRREIEAKLYEIFRGREIDERPGARKNGPENAPENGPEDTAAARRKEDRAERERWGELCALLNNDSARWQLLPDGLPHVTPESYGGKIELPSPESQQLLAMQLEAARLRKLGVIIEYWPSIHTNFYSPSLFDSSGGSLEGFMQGAKDTRVSLNTYFSLDVKGDKANSYLEAENAHRAALSQARQKMREYKEKAAMLLESWRQYREWKQAMEGYISFRRRQGAAHPDDMRRLHGESQTVMQELLEQERKNIERECALIQEYGLPEE